MVCAGRISPDNRECRTYRPGLGGLSLYSLPDPGLEEGEAYLTDAVRGRPRALGPSMWLSVEEYPTLRCRSMRSSDRAVRGWQLVEAVGDQEPMHVHP